MIPLYAAVSRQTISPPSGIYLMGYGNRVQGNIGIHDDLKVTTIVLADGNHRAALLTVDHAFVHHQTVEQIKARLHETCDLAPEAVFVCCSHTHSGPIGYADAESSPEDRAYIALLVNRCVDSVVKALDNLEPVDIQGGTAEAAININRRERTADGSTIIGQNPAGPVDHTVSVIQLQKVSGSPLAILVNYSCHPVVLGPRNRLASADWVGVMRRTVEAETGGLCLFFQGAAGDINPRKMSWTRDNWDEVEEQGAAVAQAVLDALNQCQPLAAGSIRTAQEAVWVRLSPDVGNMDYLRPFLPEATTLEAFQAALHKEFPWAVEIEPREEGNYTPIRIGTLHLGEWTLAALGTEPFTETGQSIKQAAPAALTFVVGYTNGCNSYLPVPGAYAAGGYEVEGAPLYYGLPAGFSPDAEPMVREAVIHMLNQR